MLRLPSFAVDTPTTLDEAVATLARPGARRETLEIGDFFGEFAFLDGIPHPMTNRTRTPAMLLSLSHRELLRLFEQNQEVQEQVMAVLDRRLDGKLEELIWSRIGDRTDIAAATEAA